MTRPEDHADPATVAEIQRIQRESATLAVARTDSTPNFRAAGTTTVSIRMNEADVRAITELAEERGVPISHLMRLWILDGLAGEPRGAVNEAFQELDRALETLRRAVTHSSVCDDKV